MIVESMQGHERPVRGVTAWELVVLAVAWCLLVAAIEPFVGLPLNDDWSYAVTVERLLDDGDFRPIAWVQALHVSHALWGTVFAAIGGMDYDMLRASTLVLALAGTVACFCVLRGAGVAIGLAALATVTVVANPLYVALSVTYMTDVPFAVAMLLAACSFAAYLQNRSRWTWIAAVAFALFATLNRQIGLALPAAFAVAAIACNGLAPRKVVSAVLPFAICALALFVVEWWLRATGRMPAFYNAQAGKVLDMVLDPGAWRVIARHGVTAMLYLGLLLSPLLAWMLAATWRSRPQARRWLTLGMLVLTALFGALLATKFDRLMPLSGNIIVPSGIGPLTLRDAYFLDAGVVVPWPAQVWMALSAVAVVGAAALSTLLAFALIGMSSAGLVRRGPRQAAALMFLLASALYLGPAVAAGFFDRYLVPGIALLVPGLVLALGLRLGLTISEQPGKTAMMVSWSMAALMGCVSILATRDYLAWNVARWELLARAESRGLVASQIDGGYEYNGVRNYDPDYQFSAERSWWWVGDDRHVVAFGPIAGHVERDRQAFVRLLPPGNGEILLLEREGRADISTSAEGAGG